MEILAKRGISTFLIKVKDGLYCRLKLYPRNIMIRPLEADNADVFLKEKYYETFDGNEEESKEVFRIMRLWGYINDEDISPPGYDPSKDYVASLNRGK